MDLRSTADKIRTNLILFIFNTITCQVKQKLKKKIFSGEIFSPFTFFHIIFERKVQSMTCKCAYFGMICHCIMYTYGALLREKKIFRVFLPP